MPKTTADKMKELDRPAMCELLPVRDFLDDVMVKEDGSYTAGFKLSGAMTYFADDDGRNETKRMLESLFLTIPEESLRIQFRYEVVEHVEGLLERYRAARTATNPRVVALDEERIAEWERCDAGGEYLTRYAAVYLTWNAEKHQKVMEGQGGKRTKPAPAKKKSQGGVIGGISEVIDNFSNLFSGASVSKNIERTYVQHHHELNQFEALLMGVEASLKRASMNPHRMTHEELFIEIKRALNPVAPDDAPLRQFPLAERYVSAREQLAAVSLRGQGESYLNIDGVLWSAVTLKLAPDTTFPGVIRELLTLGFPLVISTQIVVPDQQKVLEVYKRRYKKMQAALSDGKGGQRADIGAAVAAREILAVQEKIIASSVKTCRLSLTVAIRTSASAYTDADFAAAEQELSVRTQKVQHVIGRMNSARGYAETLALRDIFIDSLPGMADDRKRDLDLLTEHAADLVAVEMPWAGTMDDLAMLFKTPYRQLVPVSHFSPSLENANMILGATSGTGKGMFVGKMAATYARMNVKVSILERGDSYKRLVEYMGGQMITMSLDSPITINPFDLDPGQTEPANDHLAFLKTLIRYMVGESTNSDADLLDSVLQISIKRAYDRAAVRLVTTPTLGDVRDELAFFIDEENNARVNEEAHIAAIKLRPWVDNGMYAKLFDRPTTVEMSSQWLYFNIEKLKDDPKLETAMSLLIAYATTRRAQGTGREKAIVILDECWSLFSNKLLADVVEQLFRTARKRNACVWGISQAIADFTGSSEKPNPYGEAIMMSTAMKMIGRQKGNLSVLSDFVHVNDTTLNYIKNLPMTEKGKQSEFVGVIGENAETTFSVFVIPTPMEYWLLTTYPREKDYVAYWMRRHTHLSLEESYQALAKTFPNGLAALAKLPEEVSGEVWGVAQSMSIEELLEVA